VGAKVLFPQLQLWHIYELMFIQPVGELHSQVTKMIQFLPHGDFAPVVQTHQRLDDVNRDNRIVFSLHQYQSDSYRH
jgi:hypothetical protein